ncbi:MAG: hypothetical protein HY594_02405 [Candidatus Omnitrophica bacterium]|nr:hypothetical protein [Candidatus Omnitrophota bacterium]
MKRMFPEWMGMFLAVLAFVVPGTVWADQEEMVIKEQKGLRFKLPADWPVEERSGAVGPIPTEEYLSRKFSALNSRLDSVEKRLGTSETGLRAAEQRMGAAEAGLRSTQQRLASVEEKQFKTEE